MKLADRIEADPETCSGHPRIAGTRIRVSNIIEMLADGLTHAEILEDYPHLNEADIRAALKFAAAAADRAAIAAE